ncbi:hypothetical protein ACLB1R_04300 [Escherichia coli]
MISCAPFSPRSATKLTVSAVCRVLLKITAPIKRSDLVGDVGGARSATRKISLHGLEIMIMIPAEITPINCFLAEEIIRLQLGGS